MINRVPEFEIKELQSISPSSFVSMRKCRYRFVLQKSLDKVVLLPSSPNAYFGSILHKAIEEINNQQIKCEDDLMIFIESKIKSTENYLKENNFIGMIPLKKSVKDYGMKIILLKRKLESLSELKSDSQSVQSASEMYFECADGNIKGIVDHIFVNNNAIELIDYKTGKIIDEYTGQVKEDYKEQLKLYAYLYFEKFNGFPDKLSIVGLNDSKYTINFNFDECLKLFNEAKELLEKTNQNIKEGKLKPSLSKQNCIYCSCRPACFSYQASLKNCSDDVLESDVYGTLKSIRQFLDGTVNIIISNINGEFVVKNIRSSNYEELTSYRNKNISLYNLYYYEPFSFRTNDNTVIYAHSQ